MTIDARAQGAELAGAGPVALDDAAVAKVAALLHVEAQAEDLWLRVAVKPGGCSGYSYELFFDTEIELEDRRYRQGEVRVAVDPASAELLEGATLHYRDELGSSGFSLENPNAARTCGCGSSFC